MRKKPDDQSIQAEPHLAKQSFRGDPSEQAAIEVLHKERRRRTRTDQLEQSIWEEPAVSPELVDAVGKPEYPTWLAQRRLKTSAWRSWMISLGAALCAGPWAVLGVILGGAGQTAFQLLAIVLFGPVAEEVMKAAVPLYIVEKRPYLFRSRLQIGLCALGSGLAFAAIENLIYLRVYVKEPSALFVQWRWTVCVALHVGCALIYSLGLMRIWRDVWQRRARPQLHLGIPHATGAMVLHGGYNALMVVLSMAMYRF